MNQGLPQNLDELATGLLLECLLAVTIGINSSGAQSKHKQKGVNIVCWSILSQSYSKHIVMLSVELINYIEPIHYIVC